MTMSKRQLFELYGLAALILLILQLGLFAAASPFDGPYHDDWSYMHVAQRMQPQNEWLFAINNRQFALLNLGVAHIFLPGRFQVAFYLHVFDLFAVSLGLFHIFRRLLPQYVGFGLLVSAVYVAYIPYDYTYQTYWLLTYSGPLLLGVIAFILLIEHQRQTGIKAASLLLGGVVVAYMAARAHESNLPLIVVAPLVLFYMERKVTRRGLAAALLWWAVVGVAAAQFIVPYVRGDESAHYQTLRRQAGFHPLEMVENAVRFNQTALPSLQRLSEARSDYLLPTLLLVLLMGAAALLFWRRFSPECRLPAPRLLFMLMGLGFILITLGGATFIYAGLDKARGQIFAAPGTALLMTSAMALIALGAAPLLRIKVTYILALLLAIVVANSAQQMLAAHFYWSKGALYEVPFNEKAEFSRQMKALVPAVRDHSLILVKDCRQQEVLPLWMVQGSRNEASAFYLYGKAQGKNVRMLPFEGQNFNLGGLNIPESTFYFDLPADYFRYDEMIILQCTPQGLEILDAFPEEYTYPNTNYRDYNPYQQISAEFITGDAEKLLSSN